MDFCASCGRQREGDARFCRDCGAEFTDYPPTAGTPAPDPVAPDPVAADPGAADTPAPDAGSPATRLDLKADVTQADPPDPFASWYRPEGSAAAGPGNRPAGQNWQPTETVGTAPAAYPPGSPLPPASPFPPGAPVPPGGQFPPGPRPRPASDRRSRRGLFAVVAVVAVLAAGGGAYALVRSLGSQPSGWSGVAGASSGASASGSASASASGGASQPPAPSPSPSPLPSQSLVSVAPGVTSSARPAVESLLSRYFAAINAHDYSQYASTLNETARAKETETSFDSGYASTTDSAMTLTSLAAGNGGGLTATVTFTSRQSPSQSVDKSNCNNWTLKLPLVADGSGYLIAPAPAGYQPAYSDC